MVCFSEFALRYDEKKASCTLHGSSQFRSTQKHESGDCCDLLVWLDSICNLVMIHRRFCLNGCWSVWLASWAGWAGLAGLAGQLGLIAAGWKL